MMEPRLHDGDYAVFRARPAGSRQGKIVLAQYRGIADPDTGGTYTVKKYSSEKQQTVDGTWRHSRVILSPFNPEYQPIVIPEADRDDFVIVAELVGILQS